MRVAVTGSTGFVGTRFRDWCRSRNWDVTPILRNQSLGEMTEAFERERVDAIVHLASLFVGQHEPGQVADLVRSNVEFGALVCEAARLANVTCVLNVGTDWQDFEGIAGRSANLYAATKSAFECILRYYQDAHGFKVYHVQLTDTFGTSDPRPKILPKLLSMKSGERLELSPGEQLLRLTYVGDVVAGLAQALELLREEPQTCYRRFALASDEALSLRSVVSLFEEESGRKLAVEWGARAYRPREVMKPALLEPSVPGWRPQVDLRTGIQMMLKTDDADRA